MQQTPSITNAAGRLFSALGLVWMAQLGISVWFMIGQGYDRATADLVPIAGLAFLPLLAWLMRAGLPDFAGSKVLRVRKALLQAAMLYFVGLIVPAQAVLHGFALSSPFDELWWIIGISTAVMAIAMAFVKGLSRASASGNRGYLICTLIILGSVAGIPLWRAFVFSFFD